MPSPNLGQRDAHCASLWLPSNIHRTPTVDEIRNCGPSSALSPGLRSGDCSRPLELLQGGGGQGRGTKTQSKLLQSPGHTGIPQGTSDAQPEGPLQYRNLSDDKQQSPPPQHLLGPEAADLPLSPSARPDGKESAPSLPKAMSFLHPSHILCFFLPPQTQVCSHGLNHDFFMSIF